MRNLDDVLTRSENPVSSSWNHCPSLCDSMNRGVTRVLFLLNGHSTSYSRYYITFSHLAEKGRTRREACSHPTATNAYLEGQGGT